MELNKVEKNFQNKGFVEVRNFFSKKELNTLNNFVSRNLKINNDKTFF